MAAQGYLLTQRMGLPPNAAARPVPRCQLQRPTPLARAQRPRPVVSTRAAFSSMDSMSSGSFSSLSSIDFDDLMSAGEKYMLRDGTMDYYALLQVDDDASTEEIKKAYRKLAKVCHPDFLGDDGHNICILLNEAYQILSDPSQRTKYNAKLEEALKDEEDDYTGKPLSKWMPSLKPKMAKNTDPGETRGVFVDEHTCIGCKQCVWHASATFRIEPEHGRSRVFAQWLDSEDHIQAAIDSCPVSCIHWVEKADLPALEYVMQVRMKERTNVGVMMSGQGATADVWAATEKFLKERRRLKEAQEQASKARAYSPAQAEARRAAANALRRQNMGMFAKIGEMMDKFAAEMNATVQGLPEDMVKVGKRKRSVRWDGKGQQQQPQQVGGEGDDYYLVPPERALVPVTSASRRD